MIKRRALQDLSLWLRKPHRKPLILRGARQVGKSTLVRLFAEEEKLILWEVNLERHPGLAPLFATRDPQRILRELPLVLKLPPAPGGPDLLFLDEIQEIPEAILCLRYFYEEHSSLPVIAAGSLLEFTLSQSEISMPVGRTEYLWLGPLDFLDFLSGTGDPQLANFIDQWSWGQEILPPLHEKLLGRLRDYFLVGGLPEAVQIFAETGQYVAAREIHQTILQTYKDDFGKYAQGAQLERIRRIFEILPQTMGEKTKYRAYHPDWKAADIRQALELLERAGILNRVVHSDASGLPLGAQEDPNVYKLFFLDIGLSLSSWNTQDLDLSHFVEGRFVNEGPLAEQFCAQALISQGSLSSRRVLHYWLREGKSNNAEVDFVLSFGQGILPLEVKSGTSGGLRSLHQFMAHKGLSRALRCDTNPPSIQMVETQIMQNQEKLPVKYELFSLPLYLLPGQGWKTLKDS